MALAEAAKFFTGFEAELARGRLEADGIESVLFETNMNWGGFDLGVVPVRWMVDEDDVAAAQAVLAALSASDTDEAAPDRNPHPGPWR